jgi:hypothetical protein
MGLSGIPKEPQDPAESSDVLYFKRLHNRWMNFTHIFTANTLFCTIHAHIIIWGTLPSPFAKCRRKY